MEVDSQEWTQNNLYSKQSKKYYTQLLLHSFGFISNTVKIQPVENVMGVA